MTVRRMLRLRFSVQYCQLPALHHRGGNLLTVDLKEQ